jgi:hypothetical protein
MEATDIAKRLGQIEACQDILRLLAVAPNPDVFVKLLLEYAENVDKQETKK